MPSELSESDLFCKNTVHLIEEYFDEFDYMKRFITEALADQHLVQLHFLKTFIIRNFQEIEKVVLDAPEQPELKPQAELFETYLQIFTVRLCELEPESVELWVGLEFFPKKECMEVCRQWRNQLAEAFLMEKLGDGIKAIEIYLQFIEKID